MGGAFMDGLAPFLLRAGTHTGLDPSLREEVVTKHGPSRFVSHAHSHVSCAFCRESKQPEGLPRYLYSTLVFPPSRTVGPNHPFNKKQTPQFQVFWSSDRKEVNGQSALYIHLGKFPVNMSRLF